MQLAEISPGDRAAIFAEVDRLTDSTVLHGSEALCRLLRYLADQCLAQPGVPVKEYQLAIDVFGRPANFDPRLDSTVRVQTGRLRSKIAEYYASVGAEDPVVIDIPKGSYSLTFQHRTLLTSHVASASSAVTPTSLVTAVPRRRNQTVLVWALALISLVSTGLLAINIWRTGISASIATVSSVPEPIRRFWAPFTDSPSLPWIIFSNAEFVGRPQDGMRYFDPDRDSKAAILDHYTGVGEVLGVAELSRVFSQLRHDVRIKRGRLLSLDDAKSNDLIFIGSPAENLTLREITTTREFIFHHLDSGESRGDMELVNVHPGSGEPLHFRANHSHPLTEDYGLIALVPGINPARWVLVLAGTTTMGTQAAAEFVCREQSLRALESRLPGNDERPVPFEAVIRVRITGGVPVDNTLVAIHLPAR